MRRMSPALLLFCTASIVACIAESLGLGPDGTCSDRSQCISSCEAASAPTSAANDRLCTAAACDAGYGRCRCAGAAALRLDGGCQQATQGTCGAQHDVLLTTALWSSPELGPHDVARGVAPAAFETILLLSISAALGRDSREVALADVKLVASPDVGLLAWAENATQALRSWAGEKNTQALLAFDISLSLCTAAPAPSTLDPRDFEWKFIQMSQQFAAFRYGTIRLLSLRDHGVPLSEATWGSAPEDVNVSDFTPTSLEWGSGASLQGSGSAEDADTTTWEKWDILGCAVGGLIIFSLLLILAVRTRQLYCLKYGCTSVPIEPEVEATPVEEISRQEATSLDDMSRDQHGHTPRQTPRVKRPMSMTGTLVLAKLDFCPSEVVGNDQGFKDRCLRLRSGDVMEVLLDRENGWLYGFRVGHRAQRGYFPENRVSWIGRPVAFSGDASLCSLGVPEDAQAGEVVVASARSHFPAPPTSRGYAQDAARSRSQSADERGLGSARSSVSCCSSARAVGSARSFASAARAGELALESARSSQYSAAQSLSAPQTARSHYAAVPPSARSQHVASQANDLVIQSARSPYALDFARLGA